MSDAEPLDAVVIGDLQPRFPGADTFAGLSLHTGNWPTAPVSFAGGFPYFASVTQR